VEPDEFEVLCEQIHRAVVDYLGSRLNQSEMGKVMDGGLASSISLAMTWYLPGGFMDDIGPEDLGQESAT